MKTPFYLILSLIVLGTACKSDESEARIENYQQVILNELSHNLYLNSYATLKSRAQKMFDDVQSFTANPTEAGLDLCRADWKSTREVWENSEAWLFGPVSTQSIDPRIDTWPVDFIRLDSVLNSNATINEAFVNGLEESLKGFHPMEYLLFGKNGNKTVAEFDARQMAFLLALSQNLNQLCSELHTAWAPQGGKYVDELTLTGQQRLYPNKLSAYEEITNAMIGICDEVANGKINEVFMNLDSMGEESPFAKNSITDFTNNIKGVQMVYLGPHSSGTTGLVDFVRTFNLSLDARIKQKINTAISALGQITDPFGRAIFTQPIQVQGAIDAINDLKNELETGLLPLVQLHVK